MNQAKKFLRENLIESQDVAAKIFNVNSKSLSAFIKRGSDEKNEEHNKMLQKHEINAFDDYIRSLLKYEILSTSEIVFSAIVELKRAHRRSASSKRWFRNWWKQDHLHKIRTKSLSIIRFEVDHEKAVVDWFLKYKNTLRILNIRRRRNIMNFDEIDFRSECMKKQKIIVSIEIRKHYQISSENRKSLIIIEMINAVEEFFFSFMIIIQKQDLMISWFDDDDDDELSEDTYVMLSESEFISDKIALKFLKHYIKHSDADSDAEWKLMLMNNHESHIIFEFIAFANENRIRSFSLISHLTHCMQSLDVGIFQFYKHWHDQVIQDAVVTSFVKYSIEQFLHDLTKIRNHTFKSSTIWHAFEKFQMWSVNEKQCIKQLKHFNKHVETTKLTLSLLRQIRDLIDIQHGLKNQWNLKIADNMQWSDSVREEEFRDFINSTKQVIVNSLFKETELQMWQTTRQKKLNRKKFSRKRLRFETDNLTLMLRECEACWPETDNLRLIKENAKQVIIAKLQKEKDDEKKRIDAQFMRIWRMKRDEMHTKGVAARKVEKARIKEIKEMTKNHLFISVELLQLIHDLEVEWKKINEIWLVEQEKKDRKKKPRLEKSVEDDDDDEEDFISFEDENKKNENAKNAKHARHDNLRTNHSIDDEFNSKDFFDDMNDERAFETLYN